MAPQDPSRESHFPSIEKKYGEPVKYWFKVLEKIKGKKYPEQIAYLRENYGFSQSHANALVMYSRGSTTTRRFETPTDFYTSLAPIQAKTVYKIFQVLTSHFPELELVIAWNQPMMRIGIKYIFGVSVAKNHILLAPWDIQVLVQLAPLLSAYKVNKKTVAVPNDWAVDEKLLVQMVQTRISA